MWDVWDARTHHPCLDVTAPDLTPLPKVLRRFDQLRIALLGVLTSSEAASQYAWVKKHPSCFLDISWIDGMSVVDHLARAVGVDRLLLGTNAPLTPPLSAFYKLRETSLSRRDITAITERNARRFIGKRFSQSGKSL